MKRICIFVLTLALLGAATLQAADTASSSKKSSTPANVQSQETGYWINNKSHIRHNKSCRYYGKGKNGQPCGPNDGKACKVCGG